MRIFAVAAICIALGGCYATSQEVRARLGDEYVGKSVDALVVRFGPPASQFRMSTGETSHVWQLSSVTNIEINRHRWGSSGSATTKFCKLSVIASPAGVVTKLTTEDSRAGLREAIGNIDFYGSVCANHLGIRREG